MDHIEDTEVKAFVTGPPEPPVHYCKLRLQLQFPFFFFFQIKTFPTHPEN